MNNNNGNGVAKNVYILGYREYARAYKIEKNGKIKRSGIFYY